MRGIWSMPTKFQEQAVITEQKEIAEGIFSLWLQTKDIAGAAKAGQFISIYCDEGSRILPRPISICEIDREAGKLHLVYRIAGKGTEEFSRKKAGDTLKILGPLGNGFPQKKQKAFLIGGGIGVPPMLQLVRELECEKTVVLGYRNSEMFLYDEFRKYADVAVATEDGSVGTKGNVIDAIKEQKLDADIIYACGPTPMLKALKAYAEENQMECYISLEEKMACGIGACLACVCQTKDVDDHSNVTNARICKDGPVFDAQNILFLTPDETRARYVASKAEEKPAGCSCQGIRVEIKA